MLKKYLDKIRPSFEKGGSLHCFRSVFEGFESFLYVPNTTSKSGTNIHDSIDSKRIMSIVVIALLPALLFGMYNIGWQNYAAAFAAIALSFGLIYWKKRTILEYPMPKLDAEIVDFILRRRPRR